MSLSMTSKEPRCRPRPSLSLLAAVFFLITSLTLTVAADESPVTTILLVRHAEKAARPADDPPLTPAGRKRARALRAVVREAGVTMIFATNRIRTRQTVLPSAKALGLNPEILNIRDVQGLVSKILSSHRGEVILAAGHSGTVPRIVEKLGGGKIPPIHETDYDNLFVVTVYARGKAKVVRLRYGDPT